jgi:predicted small secreted protein
MTRMSKSLLALTLPVNLIALAAGVSACGCDDTASGAAKDTRQAVQAVQRTADRAGRVLDQQVSAFKRESRVKLKDIGRQIDQLAQSTDRNGEKATDQARRAAQQALERLRAQKAELEQTLDRLAVSSRSDWHKAKRDFARRLTDLGRSVNRALDKAGDEVQKATN